MSDPHNNHDPAIWFILDRIQDDVSKLHDKWEDNIITSTKLTENLHTLTSGVVEVRQLMLDLRGDIEGLQKHLGVSKTKGELRLERWKSIGKLAGLGMLILPGILSFLMRVFS
jgi:hypothetical protein